MKSSIPFKKFAYKNVKASRVPALSEHIILFPLGAKEVTLLCGFSECGPEFHCQGWLIKSLIPFVLFLICCGNLAVATNLEAFQSLENHLNWNSNSLRLLYPMWEPRATCRFQALETWLVPVAMCHMCKMHTGLQRLSTGKKCKIPH